MLMKINDQIIYLRKAFPAFDGKVMYDVDRRGTEFCEMVMPNPSMPNMPLAVSLSESGCSLSAGQFDNVTGHDSMTVEQLCSAIRDVISDKIIFVMAYSEDDDVGFGKPFMTRIFAITGDDDDMSQEYKRFIAKISSPLGKFARRFTSLKGRFIITNYSGSINKIIIR